MANNPENRKLSHQFGDVTGSSEESTSGESWYTPERVESMRAGYAEIDPNYAAVRNARQRSAGGSVGISRSGTGPSGDIDTFGTSNVGDAVAQSIGAGAHDVAELKRSGETTASEGGASTAYDESSTGRGRRFPGVSMGGWDTDASKRSSPFESMRPRNADEAAARKQGEFFLKLAGPTCNHPTCQGYRAKGMELLGGVVSRRQASLAPEEALGTPIPSVRKDTAVPPMNIRKESAGKKSGELVGRFAPLAEKGVSTDMGDFEPDYKNTVMTPSYTPASSKDPRYQELMVNYKAKAKAGDAELFHPDDWLEHKHAPGEEMHKLPWEK